MPTIDTREQGPAWADVVSTLKELEGLHGGTISLTIGLSGTRRVGLTIEAALWRVAGRERPFIAALAREYWPNRNHRTMPGLLYTLLLKLDNEYDRKQLNELFEMPTAELPAPPPTGR